MENLSKEAIQRTTKLGSWANQWSTATKLLDDEVKQLAQQILQVKRSAIVASGSTPAQIVSEVEFRDELSRLHHRVAEQEILLGNIKTLLQANLSKPNQESLLSELTDLHKRVEVSEKDCSLLKVRGNRPWRF